MTDKTLRTVAAGAAVSAGDLFLTRQGADTVDKSALASQIKTFTDVGLQPLDAQLTSVAALDYTANALKVIRVNAGETDFELATITSGATNLDGLTDCITNYPANNMFLGSSSGINISSGDQNTAVGKQAMKFTDTGANNAAFGNNALCLNTSGSGNAAFGNVAMENNATGIDNTAFGNLALTANTTASENTALGSAALLVMATGGANTAVGRGSLASLTSGTYNTAIGQTSGYPLVTGSRNVFMGSQCVAALTTGNYNVIVGDETAPTLTSGSNNTIIGKGADVSAASSSDQIVIGAGAIGVGDNKAQIGNTSLTDAYFGNGTTILHADGSALTGIVSGATNLDGLSDVKTDYVTLFNMFLGSTAGGTTPLGSRNVTLGQNTMAGVSTSLADNNTAVGYEALKADTSGYENTAVGSQALTANTSGNNNTAIGPYTLIVNTTGIQNTAVGPYALTSCTSGTYNTAVGPASLTTLSTGTLNTGLGAAAGNTLSTGSSNTLVGRLSATTLDTGSNNVVIGESADVSSASATGRIAIGTSAVCNADNTWVMGTIGKKQAIVEGSNAAMGVATLVAGTVTVSNTLVTADSRIFLTAQSLGTVSIPSGYGISTRTPNTSFTILASVITDTSVIAWEIKEPN